MKRYFQQHSVLEAQLVKDELMQRKEMISDALKGYVTMHYRKFIDTSKEILSMLFLPFLFVKLFSFCLCDSLFVQTLREI